MGRKGPVLLEDKSLIMGILVLRGQVMGTLEDILLIVEVMVYMIQIMRLLRDTVLMFKSRVQVIEDTAQELNRMECAVQVIEFMAQVTVFLLMVGRTQDIKERASQRLF